MASETTISRVIPISEITDLTDAATWFFDLLPQTAHEELAKAQAEGSLLDPITYVDGRKSDDEESVKPFGNITYSEPFGPIEEAIKLAQAFVQSQAPVRTGHYRSAFQWFANGQQTSSPPSAERIGLKGNAELTDLAPYASMVEVFVPRSVIYGAFTMLSRRFGKQLSIGFRYSHAHKLADGFELAPGKPAPKRPYAIPVLTIGNPASSVIPGVRKSRPGYSLRRNRRTVRKYLKEKGLL